MVVLRRIERVHAVELGLRVVPPALVSLPGMTRSGRRDEGDPALRERLLQRPERDFRVVGPAIGFAVTERGVIVAGALHVGNRIVIHSGPRGGPAKSTALALRRALRRGRRTRAPTARR